MLIRLRVMISIDVNSSASQQPASQPASSRLPTIHGMRKQRLTYARTRAGRPGGAPTTSENLMNQLLGPLRDFAIQLFLQTNLKLARSFELGVAAQNQNN